MNSFIYKYEHSLSIKTHLLSAIISFDSFEFSFAVEDSHKMNDANSDIIHTHSYSYSNFEDSKKLIK